MTWVSATTLHCVAVSKRWLRKKRARAIKHGGSRPGRSANLNRDNVQAYKRFYKQYLSPCPTYTDEQFRRRFRMSKSLFLTIVAKLGEYDVYFSWRKDCTGKYGVHPVIKVAAAIRKLAYGCSADSLDDFFSIGESTVIEAENKFISDIIELYGPHNLRLPSQEDLIKVLDVNASRGFPGMIGSIDCMKWSWKNCPSAWRGTFQGAGKDATVVLEAVATADLHIWHAFVGMPGSNNDLNVLDASPLIAEYMDENAPQFTYKVNGNRYNFLYYLADGIYPEWRCFVKTISAPVNTKQKRFSAAQEALRKDVERAFGVLQARFAVIARPAHTWSLEKIKSTLKCCVILHNMIIDNDAETGRRSTTSIFAYTASTQGYERHRFQFERLDAHETVPDSFCGKYRQVMDSVAHYKLKSDLVEHVAGLF